METHSKNTGFRGLSRRRCLAIHPASRGVVAHTAGLFRSVRGAKGVCEYEEQSSTGELTYITAGFVNIFHFPPRGGFPS